MDGAVYSYNAHLLAEPARTRVFFSQRPILTLNRRFLLLHVLGHVIRLDAGYHLIQKWREFSAAR